MKFAALVAAFSMSLPLAAVAANDAGAQRPQPATAASPDKVAEAYNQFLLGHRLEEAEDVSGAIAAYKRAMELDPTAADIPGELAGLYLRQNKIQDAIATAEQALKVAQANREANRVLGTIYAALSESGGTSASRTRAGTADENVAKAIRHLELATDRVTGQIDPNVRATLARLYVRSGAYEKAIPLLTDLVNQEPGWQDGPLTLAEAYAGAGRTKDAIAWLEERAPNDLRLLPALAEFYERERRWPEAVATYARAVQRSPRNNELKSRYGSALLNAGGRENVAKARDVLTEVIAARPTAPDARALYLLSQAQRRLGDFNSAEATARRVIAQNSKSPWGFYALAESLEQRRQFQTIVDELAPVVAEFRGTSADAPFDVSILLPHLGFAYQELGHYDKAISAFEEARRLSPSDPAIAGYLIDAHLAAKKYSAAADAAKAALRQHPNDLRLTRLQARALRLNGKTDQGIAILEEAVKNHSGEPLAYISLAQIYADADRGAQAVRVLQDAQAKFPTVNAIAFELGTVFDKQKKFAEAETAFKQVLTRDPENATALNYLGYMLAERGERLDESVGYLKKALEIEPGNGSFLDSLGWAYFKADNLNLAEENLRRAADQLRTNSVIQEHYGQVLFKLGRYDEAIAAWTRALNGDGDSIDKSDIDKKIRAAKQKLQKK
jgi:tetratricopeptide (TPR) repeat protein